jgi:diguanylate cyclase (GGDEF)-like protein
MSELTLSIWSLPELVTACFCWAIWFIGLSLKSNEVKTSAIIGSYRIITFALNTLLSLLFLTHSGLTSAHQTVWWLYLSMSSLPPIGLRFSRKARKQPVVALEVAYWVASLVCVVGLLVVPNAFVGDDHLSPLGFMQAHTMLPGVLVTLLQLAAITWAVRSSFGKQPRRLRQQWIVIAWLFYCLMAALEQISTSGWLVLPPVSWLGVLAVTLEFARLMYANQGTLLTALVQSNTALQQLSSDLEIRVLERTQELHQLAMFDPLTGLANRAQSKTFLENALHETQNSASLALLILDLNKFKNINDTVGHQVGDQVLVQVAQRFRDVVPEGTLLARLGGDEFMLIVPEFDSGTVGVQKVIAKAETISKALLETLLPAIHIDDTEFFIGASIGISICPKDANNASSLMRLADLAMYQAKQEQLGYRRYDAKLDIMTSQRLEIERDLRNAIENGLDASFRLEYQPIVELHSRQIMGFEALLRWNNPNQDIEPAQFIPIAEETRMIVPLGTWVLFEACRQAAAWEREGFDAGRVSVNVSIHQFERPDFVETVKRALLTTGLPAHRLTLEFVESVMMNQFEVSTAKLAQLQALGVLVALDDFGTGYSSLAYLQHLTFDSLKIDRSFTRMLGLTSRPRALIAATLSIAHEFKMTTIVEGVETFEQAQELESLGCVLAQGYLFSKPMRALQATQLLQSSPTDQTLPSGIKPW